MTTTNKKNITTATEMQMIHQARQSAQNNYEMAKALVTGKLSWRVLRWAEMIYNSQKDVFKETL